MTEPAFTEAEVLAMELSMVGSNLRPFTEKDCSPAQSLHGVTMGKLDRQAADQQDKAGLDEEATTVGKVKRLAAICTVDRARRDINIVRMSTVKRIVTGLSTMANRKKDLEFKLGINQDK